jgi:hypothetical protein
VPLPAAAHLPNLGRLPSDPARVEIDRPGAHALTPEQEKLFEEARATLHRKALQGGLHLEDIRQIVAAVRAHPEISHAVVQLLMDEVSVLQGADPSLRLLNLDD